MKRVFISHSSKDQKTAMAICGALESRGHPCWMSSRDIAPGENYQGAIVRAIRDAGVMVLVFSANANNSDEIKKEMSLASQSRTLVIPVRSEDVVPSEDFTYELATRQWIDMFNDWEQSIEKLCRQIAVAIPPEDTGVRPAVTPPSPFAGVLKGRVPLVAGIAAVLLVGGASAFWLTRPASRAHEVSVTTLTGQQHLTPAASDSAKLEGDLWDSIKNSNDAAMVQSYLVKYPSGVFAPAAKARLAELTKPAMPRVEPSFSCASASNTAEKLICSDRQLALMDLEVAALYKRARANVVDPSPLADEESAWAYQRNECTNAECVREAYLQRKAEISRWLSTGGP
ncbi:MAG TPA: TIR domain-containing protein [Rhizomicrobium sp.]|jgi:hypothetical protein